MPKTDKTNRLRILAHRRNRLMHKMGKSSVGILLAAPTKSQSRDVDYPYYQDSDFYYLTGFEEPSAVAVFLPGREEGEFVLFCQPHNPQKAIWEGKCIGLAGACEDYGAHQAYPIDSIDKRLPELMLGCQTLHVRMDINMNPTTNHSYEQQQILRWLNQAHQLGRQRNKTTPHKLIGLIPYLSEARLIKSASEIKALQKAVDISVLAHQATIKACQPKCFEHTLEATFVGACIAQGHRTLGYPCIVGAGKNTCILHYTRNNAPLRDGDLVLVDAGTTHQHYTADITRTFPVNGRFNTEQRAVYDQVLATQLAVIDAIKPDITWKDLNTLATMHLTQGLLSLGILQGSLDHHLQDKTLQYFMPHGLGHWLGLDVHDVGDYQQNGVYRPFKPGMVLTVEPGIYIPAPNPKVDKRWWNIGVRIEDNVVVTPTGCHVLSQKLIKTADDIEAFMQS